MLDSVQEDIMSNVAWIMKNFKTSVHDPRILSYSVEACSTKPWNLVQSSDSFFFPVKWTSRCHRSGSSWFSWWTDCTKGTRFLAPAIQNALQFSLFRYDQSTFQAAIWAEYGWPETTIGARICFPFWSECGHHFSSESFRCSAGQGGEGAWNPHDKIRYHCGAGGLKSAPWVWANRIKCLQLLAIHCSFFTMISGFSVARPVRFAGDAELVPLDREVRCSNLQMNSCHDVGDHSEHGEHGDHGNALIMVMVRCYDTHTHV